MKYIAAVIVALALFPAVTSAAPAAARGTTTSPAMPIQTAGGRIYVVSGSVFATQGRNPAHRVINSEPIVSDTLFNTGDKSSALLKFEDGQIVTMQANSTFHVREYRYNPRQPESNNIVFSMFKGGMRFVTGLIGQQRKQAFRLSTPNATIGIRGTEFMLTMSGKAMYGQVLTGNIGMTNAGGTTVLRTGQTALVSSSRALATLASASAVPAGIFRELLSIPLNPAAIPPPAPVAPSASPVPPAFAPPAPVLATGFAGATAEAATLAAAVAGATAGAAAGAKAGAAAAAGTTDAAAASAAAGKSVV